MAVILVVEDDPQLCELAGMMIEDLGHDVVATRTVGEALSALQSPQNIDALFTDINLDTALFGGCDIAQQAIKLRPTLGVLYTTGNLVSDELRARFVEGADCLRKPYTLVQLQSSIASLLAGTTTICA